MELDLQSLFGLHVRRYTYLLRTRIPPPPFSLHLGSYMRTLLISQDRRHLYVAPLSHLCAPFLFLSLYFLHFFPCANIIFPFIHFTNSLILFPFYSINSFHLSSFTSYSSPRHFIIPNLLHYPSILSSNI